MTLEKLVEFLEIERRPSHIRGIIVGFIRDEVLTEKIEAADWPDARQAATIAAWILDRQERILDGADPVAEEIPNVTTMLAFLSAEAWEADPPEEA